MFNCFMTMMTDTLNILDEHLDVHIRDEDAIAIIKRIAKVSYATDLSTKDKIARDTALSISKAERLSVRPLARLTGINRGIVQRARN